MKRNKGNWALIGLTLVLVYLYTVYATVRTDEWDYGWRSDTDVRYYLVPQVCIKVCVQADEWEEQPVVAVFLVVHESDREKINCKYIYDSRWGFN